MKKTTEPHHKHASLGIVSSKLFKPALDKNLITRKLVSRVVKKACSGVRVIKVVAPAGYGKTTLLAQVAEALSAQEIECSWLSLDSKDSDPLRFLSYLSTLLNLQGLLEQQLGFGVVSDRNITIDHVITALVNGLEAQPRHRAVFLDDYHVLSNPEAHHILEQLIAYSPPQTLFVIASRSEPNLSLSSLKLREKLYPLTSNDLAFLPDETNEFLNQSKQLKLDEKLIETLSRRTEGWVAGLQMASLALVGTTDYGQLIGEFSGNDRDVTDYLGEVILDQQSEEVQHFLLCTSLLEKMNADLVNALLDIESAQAMLEQLEERNLFIIPLDRSRTWYRYHNLFSEFLQTRLAKVYPGRAITLYQRASDWCVNQRQIHEAVNYALLAKNYNGAADLIAGIARDLVQESGEYWTLMSWVEQMPDESLIKRPEIGLAYGWSLIFSRQLLAARRELDKLQHYCVQEQDETEQETQHLLRSDIQLYQAVVEGASDDTERCIEVVSSWLSKNSHAAPLDLITANVLWAYSSLSTFDYDEGEAAASRAIIIGREFASDYYESWALAAMGVLKIQRADLDGAAHHLTQGLDCNNRHTNQHSYMGSLNAVLLAEVCYEQNDIDRAEQLLASCFQFIDSETVVDIAYPGYRVLAMLQQIKSGLDAALDILRLGKESANRANLPRLHKLLTALEIKMLLQHGKRKEAHATAKEAGYDLSQAQPQTSAARPAVREIHERIQVEFHLDSQQNKQALAIINTHIKLAEKQGHFRYLIELLLSRSKVFKRLRQLDDALADISRALELASPSKFYRLFLDAGDEIHELLRNIAKAGMSQQHESSIEFIGKINQLLSTNTTAKSQRSQSSEPVAALLEPLTRRERQMLDKITMGETNKQIAEQLFISEQTVKWHLHQLYQKLGVKNRTSAIAKAKALGLI